MNNPPPPKSPEDDPEVIYNNQVKDLLKELDAKRSALEAERDTQEELRERIKHSKSFQLLEEGLGERAALQASFDAQQLIAQGKADEASTLLKRKTAAAQLEIDKKQAKKNKAIEEKRKDDKKNLYQNLTTIARLGGKELFEITKKLQTGVAIIDGYTAIQKAASVVGYPFNLPGIIAETARAVTTVAGIQSQTFQHGGIVGGNSFSGDQVTARVNSGEMILNRTQQAELFRVANQGGRNESQPIQVNNNTTLEVDGDTLARAVSKSVANGVELGEFE